MALQVDPAGPHRRDVFCRKIGFGYAAVHLERAHSGDQHDRIGL